jgi:hypothetical protein
VEGCDGYEIDAAVRVTLSCRASRHAGQRPHGSPPAPIQKCANTIFIYSALLKSLRVDRIGVRDTEAVVSNSLLFISSRRVWIIR